MAVRFADYVTAQERVTLCTRMATYFARDAYLTRWLPTGVTLEQAVQRVRQVPYFHKSPGEWIDDDPHCLTCATDCKGKCVLLGSWCTRAGIPYRIEWVVLPPSRPVDHMSLRVWVRSTWMWADPTLREIPIGAPPPGMVMLRPDEKFSQH